LLLELAVDAADFARMGLSSLFRTGL